MALVAALESQFAIPRIEREAERDALAREVLLDRVMGPQRVLRASEKLRAGQDPRVALLAMREAEVVGTIRLWALRACGLGPALLLGPLAVSQSVQGLGVGGALMHRAIGEARALGTSAILLVGDPDYYARFGFSARLARRLSMPGPFERHRLLGLELTPGALDRAHGVLKPGLPAHLPFQPALAA